MSGSRHARMNAVRIRKENQVFSAGEYILSRYPTLNLSTLSITVLLLQPLTCFLTSSPYTV